MLTMAKRFLIGIALLASPCWAGNEPAPPPMAVTHINGKATDPLRDFLETTQMQSMVVDAMRVFVFNIRPLLSPPPPRGFNRPYPRVEIIYDLDGRGDWGAT